MNVCLKTLQHFGDVQKVPGRKVNYKIPPGKTILGFVGDEKASRSGCVVSGSQASLTLLID